MSRIGGVLAGRNIVPDRVRDRLPAAYAWNAGRVSRFKYYRHSAIYPSQGAEGRHTRGERSMANVKINATEVSPHKVQRLAESYYKGGFFCDEAVMCALRDVFQMEVPVEVISMVSGMSVGVGKSGCMCGAANGGVAALGLLYGRTEQNGPTDPKVVKCMSLTHELHDWFRDANGKHALCCRVLTREFDMGQGEHKEQCIWFTGLCAWKVAKIVCREEGIKDLDEGTEGGDEPLGRQKLEDVQPLKKEAFVA